MKYRNALRLVALGVSDAPCSALVMGGWQAAMVQILILE